VRWRESDLFDLGKVVGGVLVQDELTDLAEGILALWPDMSKIKNVDLVLFPSLFSLLRSHGLNFQIPFGVVAFLNGLIEILGGMIRAVVCRVFLSEELDFSLLTLDVNLGIDPFVVLVDQLHSMTIVTVHVTPVLRDTTITHENHDLMDRFWILRQVIPEDGRIIGMCKMSRWMSLLSVDEMWEFGWIAKEEDWGVVCNDIPVALVGPNLDGETSWISCLIVRSRFATDGRESHADRCGLSRLTEQIHHG